MTASLHSNLETDLRMADKLSSAIRVTLADTADILGSGALVDLGSVNGAGSDTIRVGFADLHGTHFTATVAENTDVTTTALTDSSVTCAVVRHAMRRDISDLAQLTNQGGNDASVSAFAGSFVTNARLGWMDSLAAQIDAFTNEVGTTGVNMTVDDYYDALFQLELSSVEGPFFALLHPRQLADLQESLRAEGGALQFQPATADMLSIKGQGYVGNFLGVDVYVSSTIDGDGTDRKGGMWGAGALGWGRGSVPTPVAGTVFSAVNDWMAVELQRDASAALTEVIGHAYYGICVLEDSRGVEIKTDQ